AVHYLPSHTGHDLARALCSTAWPSNPGPCPRVARLSVRSQMPPSVISHPPGTTLGALDAPVTGTYTLPRCARGRDNGDADRPALAGDPPTSDRAARARPVALQGELSQEAAPGAHPGPEASGDRGVRALPAPPSR